MTAVCKNVIGIGLRFHTSGHFEHSIHFLRLHRMRSCQKRMRAYMKRIQNLYITILTCLKKCPNVEKYARVIGP